MQAIKGDLIKLALKGEFDVIIHGCNCHNVMGAGIAKQIATAFPDAWKVDNLYTKELQSKSLDPVHKLGNYTYCIVLPGVVIVNAYTQLNFYPKGIDHFDYDSFSLILRKLAYQYPKARFGLPLIGQGLAGGDPVRINKILELFDNIVSDFGGSVCVVEYDKG